MLSPSRLETVACRFEPVVKNVRSFLKDNDLAYGFPEHLLSFTDRLSEDESLRYAISLKLHALVAELPESTSHGDLVEVLLLSVGGFAIDEDTPPMQKAERTLSRIIGEVMTSPHTLAPVPPPLAPIPPPLAVPMAPPLSLLREEVAQSEIRPELATVADASPEWAHSQMISQQTPSDIAIALPIQNSPALAPASFKALLTRLTKRATSPPALAWTPAPRFVWAALVCGAVFPPAMYFSSQSHAGTPGLSHHHARAAQRPSVLGSSQPPQAAQATDLDRQTDEDLASIAALGFGPNAGRIHLVPLHRHKLRIAVAPSTTQGVSTGRASAAPHQLEADLAPRETDMPGRDLGLLAPALSGPQSPQQDTPPRP